MIGVQGRAITGIINIIIIVILIGVQGGTITGMALDFGVTIAFTARQDSRVELSSQNFAGGVFRSD